ncbi:TonB-dependent receptor [Sphingobium boeckii]|uniref:TonB-dependent receptor n=1 Tax=Sphingobium boeckii TaxID=1082345 RepID=UPI001619621A|nr:TonB-dependent receptor [Sphingobium boeckii]
MLAVVPANAQTLVASNDTLAVAATEEAAPGDIVVTARKREETLQEVPLTINVLSQAQIERQAISNLADIAKNTPGLTFADGISQGDPRLSIRGQSNIRAASQPTVGVFIDGIDIPFLSGLNTESLDISRIEVVKGPQSALFGRGVEAGAINYISRRPEFETNGYMQGEVGTDELYDIRGRINLPVSDTFAVSASGRYKNFDGFYSNKLTGRSTIGGGEVKTGAFAARYKPDDRLEVYLRTSYSDEYLEQQARVSVDSNTKTGPGAAQVWYVGALKADPDQIFANSDNYGGFRREVYTASLIVDYDIGPVTFSSISGYNHTNRLIDIDADYMGTNSTQLPLHPVFRNNVRGYSDLSLDSYSQEARVSSSEPGPFQWLAGVYLQSQKNESVGGSIYGTDRTPATSVLRPLDEKIDTVAVFGSASYQLGDLRLSGEVRYNRDKNHSVVPGLVFDETFENILPRFTAEYKLSRNFRVYASAAKGNKPGGFNLSPGSGNAVLPNELIPFNEEETWSYEAGFKSELFDDVLTFNAAAFYIDWKQLQVDDQLTTPGGLIGYTSNAGKAEVTGGEVELFFRPTRDFNVSLGYAYSPSRIIDYQLSQARTAGIVTLGRKHLPFTADHTAVLGINYSKPVSDELTVFGQWNTRYSSRQYATVANLEYVNARSVTDILFGARTETVDVTFYVNNLFDNRTPSSASTYPDVQTGLRSFLVSVADPRQIGVRTRFNF